MTRSKVHDSWPKRIALPMLLLISKQLAWIEDCMSDEKSAEYCRNAWTDVERCIARIEKN